MGDTLVTLAIALARDLDTERLFRPAPSDLEDLARMLRSLARHPQVSSRGQKASTWCRGYYEWAAAIAAEMPAGEAREGLQGLAGGLDAAAAYAAGLERDVKSAAAPSWDEFFRDELGGPDLRIIDGRKDDDV